MRNILHFFVMLPVIISSMVIGAILVGISVTADSFAMSRNEKMPHH